MFSSSEVIDDHIAELKRLNKYRDRPHKEQEKTNYSPYIAGTGYACKDGIRPESLELLMQDDMFYESLIRKAIRESIIEILKK